MNSRRRKSFQEIVFWVVVAIAYGATYALVTAAIATATGTPTTPEDCPCQGDHR